MIKYVSKRLPVDHLVGKVDAIIGEIAQSHYSAASRVYAVCHRSNFTGSIATGAGKGAASRAQTITGNAIE
jgi:hypothetical protein